VRKADALPMATVVVSRRTLPSSGLSPVISSMRAIVLVEHYIIWLNLPLIDKRLELSTFFLPRGKLKHLKGAIKIGCVGLC
jgi:hypothetical protein